MNKLDVGSKYLIYTLGSTIQKERVLVAGLLTYSETNRVPYDLYALAINENIKIDGENYTKENVGYFFNDKQFYHCKEIGNDGLPVDNGKQYLLWDDIIDTARLTKLKVKHTYALTLTVDYDAKSSKKTMIDSIKNNFKSTFGDKEGSIVIEHQASDDYDDYARFSDYESKLEKSEQILKQIQALSSLEPMIQKLTETDFAALFKTINERLGSIESNLAAINANLS